MKSLVNLVYHPSDQLLAQNDFQNMLGKEFEKAVSCKVLYCSEKCRVPAIWSSRAAPIIKNELSRHWGKNMGRLY